MTLIKKKIIQLLILIINKFLISIFYFNNIKNRKTIYLLDKIFYLGLILNIVLNLLQLVYIVIFFIFIWLFIIIFSVNSINDLFKTVFKIFIILFINIIIIYLNIPKLFIILLILLYSIKDKIFTYVNNSWHYFYKNKISYVLTLINEIVNEIIKVYLINIQNKREKLLRINTKK